VNAASAFVLAAVVAGAALVVWRNLRKGAPCSCGACGGCGGGCHCHGARGARALPAGGPCCCAAVGGRGVREGAASHAE